jgi:GNAT superfamily N-acetyltransferase
MAKPVFRPATLDDAELAADLMTAAYPSEPVDPQVNRFRWAHPRDRWTLRRFIAELDGRPVSYLNFAHGPWEQVPEGHCDVDAQVDEARQSKAVLTAMWEWIGEQAVADGARVLHAYAADDEPNVMKTLPELGYKLDRREKVWQLDLDQHGTRLLAEAKAARAKMKDEDVELIPLSEWDGLDTIKKLHALNELTVRDVPTSVPILPQTFANFKERLTAPDLPHDRFWIARHGDRAVALSFLRFPPVRGNVWTGYTCSHPDYRGRGIAWAVKLQSLAQAIELGIPFVRTANDSENAPMLHINETLGYYARPGFNSFEKRVSTT